MYNMMRRKIITTLSGAQKGSVNSETTIIPRIIIFTDAAALFPFIKATLSILLHLWKNPICALQQKAPEA
jgi:hypothetical protein